ncbi:hypothetical protein T4B_6210 [Trichinella pseudospiralis]|uniref:Uncharacterized protein n=1 Tax=Trichinella pseudospiralis TaxID=6337 RepID=A0A0V1IJW7_TRIPS|nr:hypothetical protein T4A_10684 [Trichinella pseudospiralis]KRZ22961.1 hypothetical protein T4B_6210 [Trichinella pseudospiralis]KRZ31255.1 hypothetical protein T4C_11685 [Trichinella pseudospiralis]
MLANTQLQVCFYAKEQSTRVRADQKVKIALDVAANISNEEIERNKFYHTMKNNKSFCNANGSSN